MIINDSVYITTILRWSVLLLLMFFLKGKEKDYSIAAKILIANGIIQSVGVFLELFFYNKWWPLVNTILAKSGIDVYQTIIRAQKNVNYLSGFTHNAGFTATYIVNAIFAVFLIKDKLKKPLFFFLIALFNTSLIMTGKRGQLLILLVAYSIMYIVKAETVRKGIKACLKVAALLVIAYIVGYVLYITINSDNNILYRVLKLIYDKSTSDKSSGRYELWNQAIIEIKNNFLFGIGWLNYDLKYGLGVHNTYLQVLCESGVIGLVLFILAIGTTVFHSYKLARKKFNEPINYVTSFYLIYFLMFGIVENAAINIEPLFMLFLLITAQLNYSRDFDFKDLYNNTCFRKGYKI
ncbi:MAG: O-antigen ligase family protein [Clostridia bacterium]